MFHIFRVFHFRNCLKKFNDLIRSKVLRSSSQLLSPWKSLGLFYTYRHNPFLLMVKYSRSPFFSSFFRMP